MTIELTSSFSALFNPAHLFGPIFTKELRVSSRRRRNYVLRCVYIAVLCIFILSAWYSILGVHRARPMVYQASRFSQIGRTVISSIVWFQFVVAQLIAIVMASSTISDEIRSGTLAVLMTTPIRSVQIVVGKLLSKLLQLTLLLAISLPLLAIVRIFGGVTWAYVLSSVCITLTAALLAGSLSLLLSMAYRQAHIVILVTVMAYMVVFGVLSGLCNLLAVNGIFFFDRNTTQSILVLINPFWTFCAINAKYLLHSGFPVSFSWPLHCLLMLALTMVVLGLSIRRIRKVTLGEAFDQGKKRWFRRGAARIIHTSSGSMRTVPIKPVKGPPVVWKEMYKGVIGQRKGEIGLFALLIVAFLFLFVFIWFAGRGNVGTMVVPSFILSGLYFVIMIRLAVFSAGSLTMEKEARTWPILLTTPLTNREILRGKAIAVFRRNILLVLIYFFSKVCLDYIALRHYGRNDEWLLQTVCSLVIIACDIASTVLFVIGSGLYFGVRLRTTTTAVAVTAGLYFGVTYLLCGLFNRASFLIYRSLYIHHLRWVIYCIPIITAIAMAGVGYVFARRAIRQVRSHIF